MNIIISILFIIITILSIIIFKVKGLLILIITLPLYIIYLNSNKIIDIIEQNEGIDSYNDTKEGSVIGDINSYLNTVSYYVNLANIKNNNTENINCYDRGYCIEETTAPVTDGITSKYYKVTTYININFPFFKLNFNIPITGETRKIERINR